MTKKIVDSMLNSPGKGLYQKKSQTMSRQNSREKALNLGSPVKKHSKFNKDLGPNAYSDFLSKKDIK